MIKNNRTVVLVTAMILLGAAIPLLGYWWFLGRWPTLSAAQAIQMLNAPDAASKTILVDVRPAEDFARQHISGAASLPLEKILSWSSAAELPTELQNKTLLLVCDGGWDGAQALKKLDSLGVTQTHNVRGGLQSWGKAGWRMKDQKFTHFIAPGQPESLPVQPIPLTEQAAHALAGLFIKPTYMLLSLTLAALLFGQKAADLAALCWGLFFFFVGEFFCFVNFAAFGDDSYLSEFLHSYGMVVGFGFIFYALLEGFETRLMHFNEPQKKCAAASLCHVCAKHQPVVCRALRLYQFLIPALGLLALMPLQARFDFQGYTSLLFTMPFYYTRFMVYQIYENRLLPLLALLCFAIAYLPLWLKNSQPAPRLTQIFLAAGMGIFSFSILRLSLGMIYATNQVWFTFWEETTELIFMLGVIVVLWLFRRSLFPEGVWGIKF